MTNKLTFFFMLLPYMPPLESLNAHTPAIVKWGSVVAHATPYNTQEINDDIRRSPGMQRLLFELTSDKELAEAEGLAARDAAIMLANVQEGILLDAERAAERTGERRAMAHVLQKFSTVEDYEKWANVKLSPDFYDLIGGK